MEPIIKSGQRVKVAPVAADRLEIGDIVIAEVNGDKMLHLVSAIDSGSRRVEIAGSSGAVNGWHTTSPPQPGSNTGRRGQRMDVLRLRVRDLHEDQR